MKMYDGVLKRVRQMEEKNGIKYQKTDGKLYKGLKIGYILVSVWAVAMNLLFVLGMLLVHSGTEQMAAFRNSIIIVSVCSAMIVLGYVFNRIDVRINGIISVLSSIALIAIFAMSLRDDFGFLGFKTSFYVRHFIPLALMIILMVWMTIIAMSEKTKLRKMYMKVTEILFDQYGIDGNFTDEEWDEFLKNYDPESFKIQTKPKKAVAEDE